MSIDPIERGLEQSFELEKWGRFIRECDDIDTLRETALSLVPLLHKNHKNHFVPNFE